MKREREGPEAEARLVDLRADGLDLVLQLPLARLRGLDALAQRLLRLVEGHVDARFRAVHGGLVGGQDLTKQVHN